jgi:hypothetical protein
LPRISEFYGIVIYMYYDDHARPHFHAKYAEFDAKISIETGEVIKGGLPARAGRLVREWLALHRLELTLNWERARDRQPPVPIEPLP